MDRAPDGFPRPHVQSAAHFSIFLTSCVDRSLTKPSNSLIHTRLSAALSAPAKAKSCKELQFQGEKIAAGESLHSRLSVPTADRLVSGDPFQYPTSRTSQLLFIPFFKFLPPPRGNWPALPDIPLP